MNIDDQEPFVAYANPLPPGLSLSIDDELSIDITDDEMSSLIMQSVEDDDEPLTPDEEDEAKLDIFREMNDRPKKVPWTERYEVIRQQFPSIDRLNWNEVFRQDPTIMGRILNDIIKVEVAPAGRPGKRPSLDKGEAREIYARYKGEDFAVVPFAKACTGLKRKNSIRQFARKCNMSPSHAYRLLIGHKPPTIEDMEMVAKAYGKHPSYFHEWRMAYVCKVFIDRGDAVPEAGIVLYMKAQAAAGGAA